MKEYYGNKYFHYFLYLLIKPISTKQKYIITTRIPKLLLKKIKMSIRMSEKKNLMAKKWEKVNFTKTKKYLI